MTIICPKCQHKVVRKEHVDYAFYLSCTYCAGWWALDPSCLKEKDTDKECQEIITGMEMVTGCRLPKPRTKKIVIHTCSGCNHTCTEASMSTSAEGKLICIKCGKEEA